MKFITPSAVRGVVTAPPSKSMTGRALAAALLSAGVSEIGNPSLCDDGLAAAAIIEALGARTDVRGTAQVVPSAQPRRRRAAGRPCPGIPNHPGENLTFVVRGTGSALRAVEGALDCRESGLAMRMFTPITALIAGETSLTGSGSLRSRPMKMVESLTALDVSCTTENGHAPILVRGPMKGGRIRTDASVSSQFLSGLLMALPLCEKRSTVTVSGLASAPYVRMTIDLLRFFGVRIDNDDRLEEFVIEGNQAYRPSVYAVEGDWSGASFFLVAGAIAGSVEVKGLHHASFQADRAIVGVLAAAGARVETGRDCISVETGDLKPFEFDASGSPDLFPPLVALASSCGGKSVIHGLGRLMYKESNRASALCREFNKLGIRVVAEGNTMEVYGGDVQGALVDSHNDHRIAMACAVVGLRARGEVAISGSACVSKSYPAFFSDLEAVSKDP
ncbi:MAG: 3-phosphoshikimate 1-carboxyvinyltransferase [Syntrophorhabdales bacterium]|jgi:3-phosphoshikimate 1-carboxyvinyltransferase